MTPRVSEQAYITALDACDCFPELLCCRSAAIGCTECSRLNGDLDFCQSRCARRERKGWLREAESSIFFPRLTEKENKKKTINVNLTGDITTPFTSNQLRLVTQIQPVFSCKVPPAEGIRLIIRPLITDTEMHRYVCVRQMDRKKKKKK